MVLDVLAVTRLRGGGEGFVARGHGTIVNIGSVTALMPEFFEPVYLATKGSRELVDAALAGLDMGETVTIPSLPDNGRVGSVQRTSAQALPLPVAPTCGRSISAGA